MATDTDAVKHGFRHLRCVEQTGDIDHQLRICNEPVDILTRILGPIFKIVKKTGTV